jgi:hypothetical protein
MYVEDRKTKIKCIGFVYVIAEVFGTVTVIIV